MLSRLRPHLTYANVMATIAVFVALGGTSYGLATGSIGSREIKNNSVRSRDVRNNDLRSKDVRNHSLLAKDFKRGQLPAGPRGERGPTGGTGARGATGPTFGRSGQGQCDPDTTAFLTCASTGQINLATSGRVLLIGASSWDNDLTTSPPNSGTCHLDADGTAVGPFDPTFEVDAGEATTTHNPGQGGSLAVTAVSGVLAAGPHTFALKCNETGGSIFFTDATISAALLGGA